MKEEIMTPEKYCEAIEEAISKYVSGHAGLRKLIISFNQLPIPKQDELKSNLSAYIYANRSKDVKRTECKVFHQACGFVERALELLICAAAKYGYSLCMGCLEFEYEYDCNEDEKYELFHEEGFVICATEKRPL